MTAGTQAEKTTTQSMSWLHTWGGLIAGWVLFLVFLTGTFTVFFQEISFWMQPERTHAGHISEIQAVRIAQQFVETRHLDDARLLIRLPNERRPDIRIGVVKEGQPNKTYYLDGYGNDVSARETDGGYLFQALHWRLNIDRGNAEIGIWIVGLVTSVMLALLISGIVIHKRILKDIFVFRPRASYQRSWLDGHNVSSVLSLPFLFVISFTGLVLVYYVYMPAGVVALYDGNRDAFRREAVFINRTEGRGIPIAQMKPFDHFVRMAAGEFGEGNVDSVRTFPKKNSTEIEVWRTRSDRIGQQMDRLVFDAGSGELVRSVIGRPPAQRVQSVLSGLHLAEFGGRPMHWLYFVMGLFGSVSIASGLVLFVIKRQKKSTAPSQIRWAQIASRMNVAGIAGLCIASAAYLWGNRLLPAGLDDRATLEVRCFFCVWILCFLHAWVRPSISAWIEQLTTAMLAATLLPAVNWFTTGQWFGSYALSSDWIRFSVEITTVAIGLVAGALALKLHSVRSRSDAWTRPPRTGSL